ncbi:conserved hypothetical protein [Histoplasma capsulatum H143]|uniref:Uncharacterized protein n=1 Tax=Ajellomyces capsulatus (strain H143) TaxID=544712 RepID=C6HDB4_AJECH|nr:conserved hypothetical protein [Histoplasma capsulatum H143]
MGLPQVARPYRDDSVPSSSASAHSLQSYEHFEPEDSPPAYTEDDTIALIQPNVTSTPGRNNLSSVARLVSDYEVPGGRVMSSSRAKKTYTVTLSPELSQDPEALCKLITYQTQRPPVPIIVVKGIHTESVKSYGRNRKSHHTNTTKETVVDFEFRINCLNSVLPDVDRPGRRCRFVDIARIEDWKKTCRGVRLKSKGVHHRSRRAGFAVAGTDAELEEAQGLTTGSGEPDLEEWCKRYCEDKTRVKSFTFHRTWEAWDYGAIQKGITTLIRSLNYRGHICIEMHTHNAHLTVYSPALINKLRTNTFVWWVCVLLQLWLITWPLLYIMEKPFEPITATWYARYNEEHACGLSEAVWLELFTPVIKRSVLARAKDGEMVGLEEARVARAEADRAAGVEVGRAGSELEAESRPRNWADSLVGVVRGLAEVRQEYNQAAGWGADC